MKKKTNKSLQIGKSIYLETSDKEKHLGRYLVLTVANSEAGSTPFETIKTTGGGHVSFRLTYDSALKLAQALEVLCEEEVCTHPAHKE